MSDTAGAAGPSAPARTSSRTKVKSQRAQDSEDVARLYAAAKARQKAEAEALARGEPIPPRVVSEVSKSKSRVSRGKWKGKAKKDEVYCICKKPSGENDGPMIECAECNDWFHFECIKLSEDEAEKIHDYVCPDCHEATGNSTTMIFDIATYKSPSPIPGELGITKSKPARPAPRKREAPKQIPTSSTGSSGTIDDPAESTSSSSESGSDAEQSLRKRPIKRARSSQEHFRKPSVEIKPSVPRPNAASRKTSAILPKARVFVLDKLAELVRTIFGSSLDDDAISRYAKNMEESLFESFKDGSGPKAVAGARYKTQFTLLDRSLPKARSELLADITSFKIDATGVALLTSADLASAERLEELERAKKAMLEQTVKQKDDQGTIRLGRDGFEKVEDVRDREMANLARQEQAARKEAQRRESLNAQEGGAESPIVPASPFNPTGGRESASATPQLDRVQSRSQPQSPIVKRESVDVRPKQLSPAKSNFGLTSAWSAGVDEGEVQSLSMGDQSVLDLSDIVADEPEGVKVDIEDFGSPIKPAEAVLEAETPVVWSGGIFNPAVDTSKPVPVNVRVSAKISFTPQWNTLLPHDPIAITGRVPVKASLAYLSESRLNPSRELVTVVLNPSEAASEEEKAAWTELIEFHIAKDRHAIYHPYGNRPDGRVPPHAARELYLIPLRPQDPIPDFTDLLDDFSLPSIRTHPVMLGIFIGDKKYLHAIPPSTSLAPSLPTPPTAVPPALPNAKLQELMASLNPAALQGVLAGSKSPNVLPTPPQAQPQPLPQHAYHPEPVQPGYGHDHGREDYYNSQYQQQQHQPHGYYQQTDYMRYNQPYQHHGQSQYPHHQQQYQGHSPYPPSGSQGGNTPSWHAQGGQGQQGGDNGWASGRDRR